MRQNISGAYAGLEDPRSENPSGFFKTGPGEYGEGDLFLGITVPQLRKVSKECDAVPMGEAEALLKSTIHEERLLALLILIRKYNGKTNQGKRVLHPLPQKHSLDQQLGSC